MLSQLIYQDGPEGLVWVEVLHIGTIGLLNELVEAYPFIFLHGSELSLLLLVSEEVNDFGVLSAVVSLESEW